MDDIDDFEMTTDVPKSDSLRPTVKSSETELYTGKFRHRPSTGRFTYLTPEEISMDCYGLLKVPTTAKTSIIKEAYHKQCLMTHPDKLKADNDDAFKMIVKAFSILGDAEKRRAYDSIGPIDESLPKDKAYTDEEFFDVFSKHFDKFSTWSHFEAGAPPQLGNNATDFDSVDEFYDFWYTFKSWRDFSFAMDDVEVPPEMSREERRYLFHECEKRMSKLKKGEARTVRLLVERCRKCDPRIKRRAKQKQLEREERLLSKKLSSTNITSKRYQYGSRTDETQQKTTVGKTPDRESEELTSNEWRETDIIELQKAITAFPRGTVERWKKISTFLKNRFSTDAVLLKTKELESHWTVAKDSTLKASKIEKPKAHAVTTGEASPSQWSTAQQKMLEDGIRAYQSYDRKDKWDKISQMVDGKTEAECLQRYKLLCSIHRR